MKDTKDNKDDIVIIQLPEQEEELYSDAIDLKGSTRVKITGSLKDWDSDLNTWINGNKITFLDLYDLTKMKEWGEPMEYLGEPSGGIYDCPTLEEVILPKNMWCLGVNYFQGCSSLHTIHIPAALEQMYDDGVNQPLYYTDIERIFLEVTSRNCWIIPSFSNVEVIWEIMDDNLYVSDGVLIDKSQNKIIKYTGPADQSYRIHGEIKAVESFAFRGLKLPSVIIPGSVSELGIGIFCEAEIGEVIFEEGIEHIRKYLFANARIGNITFPSSLKEIESGCFVGLRLTGSMEFLGDDPMFELDGGIIYNRHEKSAIGFIYGQEAYSVREGTIRIGDKAFCHQFIQEEMTFPDYDKAIKFTLPSSLIHIGEEAFQSCPISELTLHPGLISLGGYAFSLSKLKSIHIPPGVTTIGAYAFSFCSKLREAKIPESVDSLEEGAFYNCENLEFVDLPNTIREVGHNCFDRCNKLENLKLPGRTKAD